jgi:hypothetical protein
MPDNEIVDELVDKVIEEALIQSEKDNEEIKKRKPKPFRYLTSKKEIQEELTPEQPSPVSVMKDSLSAKIADEHWAVLGLGDVDTIENVIKRYEISRKFKEK